jgi:hypothetical protein
MYVKLIRLPDNRPLLVRLGNDQGLFGFSMEHAQSPPGRYVSHIMTAP